MCERGGFSWENKSENKNVKAKSSTNARTVNKFHIQLSIRKYIRKTQ